MKKKSHLMHTLLKPYPQELVEALLKLEKERGDYLYLVGGTVRDWLLGKVPKDLDFAVRRGAISFCKSLTTKLGGGALVPLGRQEDEAGRVVWKGLTIDIASFRKGAETIEEDLGLRDFTLNAMAMSLTDLAQGKREPELIDPLRGQDDLAGGILRACENSFVDDPLRMLRGFRLSANLGFVMDELTRKGITQHSEKIQRVSAERISYELDCIMASGAAHESMKNMADTGLLFDIFPELKRGVGLVQPSSHHLDVFHHCLETLKCMEQVLGRPEDFFPGCSTHFMPYLEEPTNRRHLKWAALFHDLGKPAVHELREGGRITFYNHDQIGKMQFEEIAGRLRWSVDDTEAVGRLIELHMHPFHLCNVQRKEKISRRACLKLCKKAGENLKGLILLAMADNLASRGEKAPEAMEKELVDLFCTLQETIDHIIQPVLSGPRLLTGKDLIETFHLEPGPVFSTIFRELEIARVEGVVHDRVEALEWVEKYLRDHAADSQFG